jgi:hypothetical protein
VYDIHHGPSTQIGRKPALSLRRIVRVRVHDAKGKRRHTKYSRLMVLLVRVGDASSIVPSLPARNRAPTRILRYSRERSATRCREYVSSISLHSRPTASRVFGPAVTMRCGAKKDVKTRTSSAPMGWEGSEINHVFETQRVCIYSHPSSPAHVHLGRGVHRGEETRSTSSRSARPSAPLSRASWTRDGISERGYDAVDAHPFLPIRLPT